MLEGLALIPTIDDYVQTDTVETVLARWSSELQVTEAVRLDRLHTPLRLRRALGRAKRLVLNRPPG